MTMDVLLLYLAFILYSLSNVCGLQCWQCIADDCSEDPTDNYKASKKLCIPGQSCQKVYFEMLEETEQGNFVHMTTVRGCSTLCEARDDFINCTERQLTSQGCVKKDCCSDGDLCNHVTSVHTHVSYTVILIQCLLVFGVIKITLRTRAGSFLNEILL